MKLIKCDGRFEIVKHLKSTLAKHIKGSIKMIFHLNVLFI